jgi:hypothetical protein
MAVDDQWDKSETFDGPELMKPAKPSATPRKPLESPRKALERLRKQPAEPPQKQTPPESSLLLMAKDLMPPARPVDAPPDIPVNLDRTVPGLPLPTRAWRKVRSILQLDRLTKRQRMIVGGVAGLAVLLGIVVAFASRGSKGGPPVASADLVQQAKGQMSSHHYRDAVVSYEASLMAGATPDRDLVGNLRRIADGAEPAIATSALDVLAIDVGKPGYADLLASTLHKSADVRHHAFALAESVGIGDSIDRVASWTLDLEQAANCDQRRDILAKIVATHDKRVPSVQKEAARYNCGAHDAPPPAAVAAAKPAATKPAAAKPAGGKPAHKTATTSNGRPKPHW